VGVVAFECHKGGSYHVNSDFVFVEFLDDENKSVLYGKPGNIVVTRLYGKATPIIRYSGLEDLVTPIKSKQDCGITSQMIGYIEGRKMDLVILPDGRNIAPFHVTTIPAIAMEKLNTFKIKQFQIIQHKVNEIEVLVIIDEKERNIGPSVETIFKEIKKLFKEKTSKEVNIIINEVDEIEKDVRSDHVKLLISKVKKNPKK
jgi:phenylacetate-coenzyme A ligase PaaK-like adenylate-forming protein